MFLFFSSLLLFLLFETSLATCKYKFIHNASELIEFSNDVNSGTSYSDYTVYLVAEIKFDEELSKQFNPIGYCSSANSGTVCTSFSGTFDGQGYAISGLAINPSSIYYVGLFGYAPGITIQNVVIDKSCSVTNSLIHSSGNSLVSGLVGQCYANLRSCIYENCVNMASVKFTGYTKGVYVGGFTGQIAIPSDLYGLKLTNCVNYGAVTHSGTSTYNHATVGGIGGEIYSMYGNCNNYVYNCLNYGTVSITDSGTALDYRIGGIVGGSSGVTITNCMVIGTVSSSKGAPGAIVGRYLASNYYYTTIEHCYWTSNAGCTSYCGLCSYVYNYGAYNVLINSTTTNELSTYAADNGWSEWSYNQNSKKITFVVYDGKGFSYESQLILVPEAERRGYSFLFWCLNQNSTDKSSNKYVHSVSGFTSDTTLYAQWVANNCTVNFDVNSGNALSQNERNKTVVFDQEIGELPEPTKRGYAFTGWYTVLEELITNESLVNNACNCSLIAHWIPNNYTVIFDVNRGNKLNSNSKEVTFDSTYGDLPTPTRDGFKFGGWYTKDNKQITEDTMVNITSTQTLYANWTANTYTVKLDVNGGNKLNGYESGIKVSADAAHKSLPTPDKAGYAFIGWLTVDGGLITNDTATTAIVSEDQTLRAGWTPNNYTVAFDANGGDELTDEEKNKRVTYDSTYDSLPTPSKTGYSFDGWFNEDNEKVTCETKVTILNDETLHAKWTANNYTISFNPNGGEEISNVTVTYDSNYTCLPVPSREGYTFLWWYIEGTGNRVDNETKVETACNHTLCAAWNKNTVIFDVNGGEELPDNEKEKEVTYNDAYDTLPTPSRKGYNFDGWFNENNEEVNNKTVVKIVSNQTLHAEWTANNYTMKLDVNGGDELPDGEKNVTVTYDKEYGTLPIPTRKGYTFNGWYTENNEHVTNEATVTDACHCTLYANWTANTYIVILEVNGGDELSEGQRNITITYDGTYRTLPTPTRTGYTFNGWYNSDNERVTNEATVNITTNQALHAEWTANNYTVFLNVGGGDELGEEQRNITVTYDETYDLLPTPTRTGYMFDGWYNEDNEKVTCETKVIITRNQTLHAEWVKTSPSQPVVPTKYVEIVFGKGDMSEEEIREILGKFTGEKFAIVKTDQNEAGETTVIIRFNDAEEAKKLLAALDDSSDSAKNFIRSASFNSGVDASLSVVVYPLLLFSVLFI